MCKMHTETLITYPAIRSGMNAVLISRYLRSNESRWTFCAFVMAMKVDGFSGMLNQAE